MVFLFLTVHKLAGLGTQRRDLIMNDKEKLINDFKAELEQLEKEQAQDLANNDKNNGDYYDL